MNCRQALRRVGYLFSVLSGLALGVIETHAQTIDPVEPPQALLQLQDSLVEVIARVEPAVVAISRAPAEGDSRTAEPFPAFSPLPMELTANRGEIYTPSGAGVVIDPNGLVLTQYLNVRPGDKHLVTTADGRKHSATIKGADPRSGLAVLELRTDELPAIAMGDANALQKGHYVLTLGNPQAIVDGGQATASWGTVTNLGQRATPTTNLNNTLSEDGQNYSTTLHHLGTLMQTDARLNWKSGGGAVVDLSGKLIGIATTAGTLPGHESPAGYAIPMTSTFRRIVNDLRAGREVEYGLLGLSLEGPDRRSSSASGLPGAVVSSVVRGSAAARAGILAGDRLVELDEQPIHTVTDLQRMVSSLPPGKPVAVKLIRGGRPIVTSVSLWKLYVPGDKVVTTGDRRWRGLKVDYSTAVPRSVMNQAVIDSLIDPAGCVAIVDVAPGSPADESGIQPNRFISHVGTVRVSTPDEFHEAVADSEDTVYLRFTSGVEGDQNESVEPEARAPNRDKAAQSDQAAQ